MSFEWDPAKDEANFRKHGVRFAEGEPIFKDNFAITNMDHESDPASYGLYRLERA